MVKRCAWGTCNSDTRYPERLKGDICFIPFPKPKSNPEKCRLWIKLCGRPHTQLNVSKINKHSFVCSKHFVNGKPSPEYPNPSSAVPDGRENVRCRPLPTKRLSRERDRKKNEAAAIEGSFNVMTERASLASSVKPQRCSSMTTPHLDNLQRSNNDASSTEEDEEQERSPSNSVIVSRYASMTTADLDYLEWSRNEANTVRQTTWALNCFRTWLKLKNMTIDLHSINKPELNTVLREFYGTIRTTKGELYGISSYVGLRAGLNRYINDPPVCRSWNLAQDPEFKSSNNVFKGVLKQIRRTGRDKATHYLPISPEDQRILKNSAALNPNNPRGLLNKVWYDIQFHFGRRGKEGNRDLRPDSFTLKRDENGRRYFTMTWSEETENQTDPLESGKATRRGSMYEQRGSPFCPVASLEKYLTKIPLGAKALYLQPRRDVLTTDRFWYTAVPLGINQLSQMLPKICNEAGTPTNYTNHSLRVTAIQVSDSGHRLENSSQTPSTESRKRWSNVLHSEAVNSPDPSMPAKRHSANILAEVRDVQKEPKELAEDSSICMGSVPQSDSPKSHTEGHLLSVQLTSPVQTETQTKPVISRKCLLLTANWTKPSENDKNINNLTLIPVSGDRDVQGVSCSQSLPPRSPEFPDGDVADERERVTVKSEFSKCDQHVQADLEKPQDCDEYYFMSLVKIFKTLSPKKKAEVRMKIERLLMEAHCE